MLGTKSSHQISVGRECKAPHSSKNPSQNWRFRQETSNTSTLQPRPCTIWFSPLRPTQREYEGNSLPDWWKSEGCCKQVAQDSVHGILCQRNRRSNIKMEQVCCKGVRLCWKIKKHFLITSQCKLELLKKSHYLLTDPRTCLKILIAFFCS